MPVVTISFDVSTPAGLADLNTFLASRSYIVGFSATQSDVALASAIGNVDAKYANVARYVKHINAIAAGAKLPEGIKGLTVGGAAAAPAKAAAAAPAKAAAAAAEDDGDDDLFGDDDDDGAAAAAALAKAKAAAAAKEEKKPKKEEQERTQVVYEVKPIEAGQDMKEMENRIRAITKEGLKWGEEFKVVDVAYGIQKLVIQAIIVSDLVGLDDIEEPIMGFEDIVQSIDLLSMNRL